jgi:glycosyltransferase involved in cell wall biosynthesis
VRVLFLHNNMPGQFKHLAAALGQDPQHQVAFITRRVEGQIPGVQKLVYQPVRAAREATHHYVRSFENAVLHGQQVVRHCQALARAGFVPDVVVAHPGWGEGLFLREVFPSTAIVNYCEYYYQAEGGDVGFTGPADFDDICRLRVRNAHLLLALEACDIGWSPTHWQKSRHPSDLHHKIRVMPDGVDMGLCRPNPDAAVKLPSGLQLHYGDEVITFVARHLEPYRGFHTFMRALPALLAARPNAQVIIAGAASGGYGASPEQGQTWRSMLEAQVDYDRSRVHFVGWLEYQAFISLLQVSAVHVYLTVPFVLSWSFLEAMACGAVLVASDTPPVREVLSAGENGFMTDFHDPERLARDIVAALSHPRRRAVAAAARRTVVQDYNLATCLDAQVEMLQDAARLHSS